MSKQKWLDYAIYISSLSAIAAGIILFKGWRENVALESSSDLFLKVLEKRDTGLKNALFDKNNVYSEMMRMYLFLENDAEYSNYIDTKLPEIMCVFPSFFRNQFMTVNFLRKADPVSEADLSPLTFSTAPDRNPWCAMARWIRLAVNKKNDNEKYSNAAFDKTQSEIDAILDSMTCLG